jgi:hypothetical protein
MTVKDVAVNTIAIMCIGPVAMFYGVCMVVWLFGYKNDLPY